LGCGFVAIPLDLNAGVKKVILPIASPAAMPSAPQGLAAPGSGPVECDLLLDRISGGIRATQTATLPSPGRADQKQQPPLTEGPA